MCVVTTCSVLFFFLSLNSGPCLFHALFLSLVSRVPTGFFLAFLSSTHVSSVLLTRYLSLLSTQLDHCSVKLCVCWRWEATVRILLLTVSPIIKEPTCSTVYKQTPENEELRQTATLRMISRMSNKYLPLGTMVNIYYSFNKRLLRILL